MDEASSDDMEREEEIVNIEPKPCVSPNGRIASDVEQTRLSLHTPAKASHPI